MITKKATENEECIKKMKGLLESLDIVYSSVDIYIEAFIHRSIVNERPDFAPKHNERLEFLGDAVLELIITENLFLQYPEKDEGALTDIRSALVRGKNLSIVSKNLGFDKYLFLGNGEELSGGRDNEYILANCLEAFLGALYLDGGFTEAKKFVDTHIYARLQDINDEQSFKDYKSLVQEYAQAEFDITPTYTVHNDFGPDHDKVFEVGIYLGEKCLGIGKGSSKKKAQESAAQDAFVNREKWNIL